MSDVQRRLRRSFAAGVALAALVGRRWPRRGRVRCACQLPAQSMDRALEQLAKQSGVDILVHPGRRRNGLRAQA